jgi:hypothetical protein
MYNMFMTITDLINYLHVLHMYISSCMHVCTVLNTLGAYCGRPSPASLPPPGGEGAAGLGWRVGECIMKAPSPRSVCCAAPLLCLLLSPLCWQLWLEVGCASHGLCYSAASRQLGHERGLAFVAGWDADHAYVTSAQYFADRQQNQDWVAETGGVLAPELSPHWGRMLDPGRVHLIFSRLLYLWSRFAEDNDQINYVIKSGTLLGFLRHGDFVPHDHDVDVLWDGPRSEVFKWCSSLPGDLHCSTCCQGPGPGTNWLPDPPPQAECKGHCGWAGVKVHGRWGFENTKLPLDLFRHDTSAGTKLWRGIFYSPTVLEGAKKRMLGVSPIWIPKNATDMVNDGVCLIKSSSQYGTYQRGVDGQRQSCGWAKYAPMPHEYRGRLRRVAAGDG